MNLYVYIHIYVKNCQNLGCGGEGRGQGPSGYKEAKPLIAMSTGKFTGISS